MATPLLVELLKGDPKTIGLVEEIMPLLCSDERAFDEVMQGLWSENALLRTRAVNAIEKASRVQPQWLQPHTEALLHSLPYFTQQSWMPMHVALLLPRLQLTKPQLTLVWDTLLAWYKVDNTFLRVACLQALVELALQHAALRCLAQARIAEGLIDAKAAVRARSRKLQRLLAGEKLRLE